MNYIYRAVREITGDWKESPPTRRLSSNLLPLTDNLWEWLRPEVYPSRRHAIFASPTEQEAHGAWEQGKVGVVEFNDVPLVGQHCGYPDVKNHPDEEIFRKLWVIELKKTEWVQNDIQSKLSRPHLGHLMLPLLSKSEVDTILKDFPKFAENIQKASTVWKCFRLFDPMKDGPPSSSGEIVINTIKYRVIPIS